jgi:hypothetical protein
MNLILFWELDLKKFKDHKRNVTGFLKDMIILTLHICKNIKGILMIASNNILIMAEIPNACTHMEIISMI